MGVSSTSSREAVTRYAVALLDLAQADGATDSVAAALGRLRDVWREHPSVPLLMRAPLAALSGKAAALADIARAIAAPGLVVNFVQVVALAGRAQALGDMIDAFFAALADRRGQVRVVATSAAALTAEQRKKLALALASALGAEAAIEADVDPALLGGIRLRIGSRLYDASLANRLDALKRSLIRA